MQSVITVPKETIGTVAFAPQDVLCDPMAIAERKHNLRRALSLGNLHRHKVAITYRLYHQVPQRVVTTVWSLTDNYVTPKGGRTLPVRAIETVKL